jgi:hypothetical protein
MVEKNRVNCKEGTKGKLEEMWVYENSGRFMGRI